MTKRAKRKLEKEALVQQSVALLSTEQPPGTVWLPEAPELDDDEAGPWVQRPDTSPEVRHSVLAFLTSFSPIPIARSLYI